MTEIKKPITITWSTSGDNQYARLLLPAQLVNGSFLTPDMREVQMTGRAEDGRIVIILEPKEG